MPPPDDGDQFVGQLGDEMLMVPGHLGFGEDYQSGDVFATSLIMKRLHLDDLAGYVMPRGQWIHLNLPAIAETEQRIQIGHDEFHQRQVGDLLHEEREPREG